MDWASLLGTASTVVSFALFLGIVLWAWSGRRRAAFALAANAPFAVPDEQAPGAGPGEAHGAERSHE